MSTIHAESSHPRRPGLLIEAPSRKKKGNQMNTFHPFTTCKKGALVLVVLPLLAGALEIDLAELKGQEL